MAFCKNLDLVEFSQISLTLSTFKFYKVKKKWIQKFYKKCQKSTSRTSFGTGISTLKSALNSGTNSKNDAAARGRPPRLALRPKSPRRWTASGVATLRARGAAPLRLWPRANLGRGGGLFNIKQQDPHFPWEYLIRNSKVPLSGLSNIKQRKPHLTCRSIQNSRRTHSESMQNSFRIDSPFVQNLFRTHSCRENSHSLRIHSDLIQNSCRILSDFIQNSPRSLSDLIHILAVRFSAMRSCSTNQ